MERIHEGKQLYYLSRVLAAGLSENVNPWLRRVWSNERIRSTDRFISRIANNSPQEIIIVQRRSITRWICVLRFYESLDNKNFETCRDAFLSLNFLCNLDCNKKKGGKIVGRIASTPMQHYDSLSFSFDAYVKSQWYHVSFDRIDSTVKRVFKIGVKMNKLLSRGKSRREVSQR